MSMAADLSFSTCGSAGGGGVRTSDRLADLAPRGTPYDARGLAARALMGLPTQLGETPYRDVRCERSDPDRAAAGSTPPIDASSPERAADVLRASLGEAVDRALAPVRRAAVLAGGGIDSAVVLALAVDWARRTGGSVFAVALDFASEGDDRPYLRALEARLGCEVVRVRPEEAAARIALMSGVDAAPFAWPTAMMEVELMARARALGAERVLMGVGGDELLDGAPRGLAALARRAGLRQAVAAARALRGFDRPRFPVTSWVVRPLIARLVPRALRIRRARSTRAPARLPPWAGPALRAYVHDAGERAIASAAESLARDEDPTIAAKSGDDTYREYLAWGRHAQGIASGIERVDPYLDRTLIATVARFEPDWMLHGGVRRGLLREAMRSYLPDSLRLRDDKARFEPALTRFVAAAGGLASLRTLRSGTHLASYGLVDAAALAAAFDAFVASPHDGEAWTTIWPALCVEAFLRARDTPS